jgi:hemoglobin-like flavoprotein
MAGQKHSREFISDTAYETHVEKASRIKTIFNDLKQEGRDDPELAKIIKSEANNLADAFTEKFGPA